MNKIKNKQKNRSNFDLDKILPTHIKRLKESCKGYFERHNLQIIMRKAVSNLHTCRISGHWVLVRFRPLSLFIV
jgi:hypothetical protein